MSGRAADPIAVRQRLRTLTRLAAQGFCISQAAEHLGISRPALWQWLQRHSPEGVYIKLRNNARFGLALARSETVRRLRVLSVHDTRTDAAKELRISDAALSQWITRNAPDGLPQMMDDYDIEENAA